MKNETKIYIDPRQAMTQALEALEYIHEGANNQGPHTGISWRCVSNKAESVITALREALAEPQEKYIYGTPLLDAMTGKANEALDKMAENARELGLDYEPAQQQEPFGYFRYDLRLDAWVQNREGRPGTAFYTSPPANKPWVGLTDEQISNLWCEVTNTDFVTADTHEFARAIEAKLREKNT